MLFVFSLIVLFGLIAAPDAAFSAASDAAVLWWTRVLPSLLPYLIASSLLLRSNLLPHLPHRAVPFMLPLFGVLGGYPVGARLAGQLHHKRVLTYADAQTVAAVCNLPNPVFLLSVVSAGFFREPKTALPLLTGIYAPMLIGLIPLSRMRITVSSADDRPTFSNALPDAIGSGITTILQIGGCLIFASVLGALLECTGVFRLFGTQSNAVRAISLGLFEMTAGVSSVAGLPIPLALRLALSAFLIQFGGLSVILQSASGMPLRLPRYLLLRLCAALLSAFAVYLLTPFFCPEPAVPTFATRAEMMQNGIGLLAVSLSSAFGLFLVFVFTFGLSKTKRTPR